MRHCATVGCPVLVPKGRCPKHAKPILERNSRHYTGAGINYGRAWRRIRDRYIEENPWCVECLKKDGVHRLAQEVDHVVPHKGDRVKFMDVNNLQSLCRHHHSAKTAREVGFGKA